MTTTVVLANMPSSTTDVAVAFLDQTKLVLQRSQASPDGKTIQAAYVYADGDPTTETLVEIRISADPKLNQLRSSIRLRTTQRVTVDSVITEDNEPIEVRIDWVTPGRAEDATKVLAMIGTAYSLCFDGVTTKVPNPGIINAMNRSLASQLYGA